ncbi:hypothetical protein PG994_000926 [Apiospora phragmitis]|uniref:Uncharacterized protein n=1 Tax=Apiospora phragmitis TaxID=2905665 RepID=A0ABR1WQY3_9PEZI
MPPPRGAGRGQKPDEWVDKLVEIIGGTLRGVSNNGWLGSTLQPGGDDDGVDAANASARGVQPDPVELSAALVSELTEDPESLTSDSQTLSMRMFRNIKVPLRNWDA